MEEETFEGQWVVDSETGIQYLMNTRTNEILLYKDKNGIWRDYESSI